MRDYASYVNDAAIAEFRNRLTDAWNLVNMIAAGTAGQNQARAFLGSIVEKVQPKAYAPVSERPEDGLKPTQDQAVMDAAAQAKHDADRIEGFSKILEKAGINAGTRAAMVEGFERSAKAPNDIYTEAARAAHEKQRERVVGAVPELAAGYGEGVGAATFGENLQD